MKLYRLHRWSDGGSRYGLKSIMQTHHSQLTRQLCVFFFLDTHIDVLTTFDC